MNTRLFIVSLVLLSLCPVLAEDAKVKHVDAREAAELLKAKKLLVIDVRTANEFAGGHIEGAKNIDYTENSFAADLGKLDKNLPVLIHCASGARSTKSLKVFGELGFTDVTHIDGGFGAWKAAGLPVTK
ncbi:MAG: Rhodanese domain protein [Verrucomicrobiaceae bacterium]|nr:Rhodanese domain protein [Verrucomicrobiaceae bacterium]